MALNIAQKNLSNFVKKMDLCEMGSCLLIQYRHKLQHLDTYLTNNIVLKNSSPLSWFYLGVPLNILMTPIDNFL